jgi:hypothetical protein
MCFHELRHAQARQEALIVCEEDPMFTWHACLMIN